MKLLLSKLNKGQKDKLVAICCVTLFPMIYIVGLLVINMIEYFKSF